MLNAIRFLFALVYCCRPNL